MWPQRPSRWTPTERCWRWRSLRLAASVGALEYALTSAEDNSAQDVDAVLMWHIGEYPATANTMGN